MLHETFDREYYTMTLVPERAELFHRWAEWRGCTTNELFLDMLAAGAAALVAVELGHQPCDPADALTESRQAWLLDLLEQYLDEHECPVRKADAFTHSGL